MDCNILHKNALKVHQYFNEKDESSVSPDFVANKGWIEKFQKRYAILQIELWWDKNGQ